MDNNQNQDQNINIQLNEMVAAGAYCNLALVNHSPSEFVLDLYSNCSKKMNCRSFNGFFTVSDDFVENVFAISSLRLVNFLYYITIYH